jgi:hypothetical protein
MRRHYSDEDIVGEANVLIANGLTYKETAERIGMPESTLANHMHKYLCNIDRNLAVTVAANVTHNIEIKGPCKRKTKYQKMKQVYEQWEKNDGQNK